MSYSSGFFDAVDLGEGQYDRVYSSAEFAHYFGLFVGNGVFPSPSTGLSVVCNTPEDMTVKVSPGSGFINGHYLTVPEGGDEYLAVPIAHASLPRIDSIVMGLDLGERQVSLYVKPGQASASPQPVTLQRDDALYELELARIFVAAGAGSITQTAITDMRTNPESCGLVTGLIDQFDVSGFFQAAYASFEEWFEEIRGQISEDLGASLQLQVNELREQAEQDRENVLSEEAKEVLGLPEEATPSDAFLMLYKSSGGAVRRNRPPLDTDAEEVGKLWVVPKMVFNNLMPNALSQSIGNWATATASLSVSGSAITAVGNASDTRTQIQAPLSPVSVGDKVFVQSFVTVNHDANEMLAELIIGTTVVAEKTLQFPTAGSTITFQAVVPAGLEGNLSLRFYSLYNTAAVQSGKGFTVRDITVWNLTEDMCEAQEGNEFTEQEAANYISSFGRFQSREYEYSTWWWVLHGVTDGSYLWHRMYDYATAEEAQAGTDDTKLMSALKTQQFLTARLATQAEVNGGTNSSRLVTPATAAGLFTNRLATTDEAKAGSVDSKWMSPLKTQQFFTGKLATQAEADAGTNTTKAMTPALVKRRTNPYISANIGDVMHTANNAELETNGAFIKIDGRTIDTSAGYPLLRDSYELGYRIANPTSLSVSGHMFSCSPYYNGCAWLGSSLFFIVERAESSSSSYYDSLCVRKSNGAVTRLLSKKADGIVVSGNQLICASGGDQTVRAVVYNESGTMVRNVQLLNSKDHSSYIYQFGSRTFIFATYNGYSYGYYSDDAFATYGTSTWAGANSYGYSTYPWASSYPGLLSGVQQDSSGNLYILFTDNKNSNAAYVRVMRSTDLGKTWTLYWSVTNTNTDHMMSAHTWFIDGAYLYANGYYQETSGSNKYNRQALLKYNLSNGSYVGRTSMLYSSSSSIFMGFVRDGKAYLAGEYWSKIINLSDMTMSNWYVFGNEIIDMRSTCSSYLTKNGRYWLSARQYTGYVPSYGTGTTEVYGGLLVYDTVLHQAVYLTGALYTSSNSSSPFIGAFCEDADGNVYIPHGRMSDSNFYDSKIIKVDFTKKTLPTLDYAYLKAKGVN